MYSRFHLTWELWKISLLD